MAIREFRIDITVEHGQLHETLSDADRDLMIDRMEAILLDTSAGNQALREGLIQVLTDQLKNNNSHEPIILRTAIQAGDDEEQLVWHCDHAKVKVKVDKYPSSGRTPHKGIKNNPFKFSDGDENFDVHSTEYEDKSDARLQKFYKFEVKGKDKLNKDLELDPCIICER